MSNIFDTTFSIQHMNYNKRKVEPNTQDTKEKKGSVSQKLSQNKFQSQSKFNPPRSITSKEEVYENQIEYLETMIHQRLEKKQKLIAEKAKLEQETIDTNTPYGELDDLIVKWRCACQEALVDLQKKASTGNHSFKMQQVLAHFHIDETVIQFDKDSEDFY